MYLMGSSLFFYQLDQLSIKVIYLMLDLYKSLHSNLCGLSYIFVAIPILAELVCDAVVVYALIISHPHSFYVCLETLALRLLNIDIV